MKFLTYDWNKREFGAAEDDSIPFPVHQVGGILGS